MNIKFNLLWSILLLFNISLLFSQTPDIEWQKCLGGINTEYAFDMQCTTDSGYIVLASADYDEGDVSGTIGGSDIWVIKLDSQHELKWQKCLGGTDFERGRSIQQTIDDGYIIAGWTFSNDVFVNGNHGTSDGWVVKLDVYG